MARLKERDYTYFTTVRSMCRTCREIVPARVFFREGKVWQQSLCPTCETKPALIAFDQEWYMNAVLQPLPDCSPLPSAHEPRNGCPHDCGPCTWHASPCQLPVLSITNACNMNCPICFTYNRPDRIYHMSVEEINKTIDWIIESSGSVDIIDITGGEPTMHPDIIDILRCCQRPEIGRVTMNSNGIRIAEDPDFCAELAELGIYVVLSFNTFDHDTSIKIHGQDIVDIKLKAIENLGKAGVNMTLLNVMIRDMTEEAIPGILDLIRSNDHILTAVFQTMTYTGQGGGTWEKRNHIPVDEAVRIICDQSEGIFEQSDFISRPSAHPLCYQLCYMLKDEKEFYPFARFASEKQLQEFMEGSYLIRLEGRENFFKDAINELYAKGLDKELSLFRKLITKLYPESEILNDFKRQKIAESSVRALCVHTHMDEDNFDCSRAMMCPDLVPSEPGRLIPACTYNLFYRMKDDRFYVKSR
ncbi:radical SAM protein [Planctomycetota bacterium]